MKLWDLIRYGCINLSRKRSRTLLTALSMAIGVMCVVVLISIGLGYEQSYRESVEAMGSLTKIDVTPADRSYTGRTAILNDRAVEAFKGIPGVTAATPVLQQPAYLKSGVYVNMVRLYGLDPDTLEAFGFTPLEGEAPGEGVRLRPEAMLTEDVGPTFSSLGADWAYALDEAGRPLVDPLSAPLRLTFDYASLMGEQREGEDGRAQGAAAGWPLRVTGLCSTQLGAFPASGFLDIRRLEELQAAAAGTQPQSPEDRTYGLVWLRVRSPEEVQAVAELIRETGLNAYSLNDMLETVKTQSRQIQGMLGAIGAVAMLVSAICVANTMMMSITERTREVGVLKVLGASLGSISAMFLVEALLVGLLGGGLGLGLSYAMARAVPALFPEGELRCVLPLWLALSGVGFAGLAALLAALLPARRAMRISPNAALRAE